MHVTTKNADIGIDVFYDPVQTEGHDDGINVCIEHRFQDAAEQFIVSPELCDGETRHLIFWGFHKYFGPISHK
jgi:hypothetical protein